LHDLAPPNRGALTAPTSKAQTSVLGGDIVIPEARGFKWLLKLRRCPLDWT
jgi:hypothetical protein